MEQCFAGIPFPSLVDIKKVVDLQFRELASQDNQPDTIIFSGNGEPTLHPEFPRAVEEVERARDLYLPEARVGVLSNGSRLGESSVFQAVSGMDLKSVKFDAGGEWLDRPLMPYDLDALITTWHNLPNLTIQSFFSEGRFDNTGSRDVEPWLQGLTRIQPKRVQIYTLDRVPPVKLMRKASGETLRRLAEKVKQQAGCEVEVFE